MIIGTGTDLLDIRRLEKIMARYGERFKERYFTAAEIEIAEKRRGTGNGMLTLAKRYAAKEAAAKALGTGFVEGIFMKDIEITNDALGKPTLAFTGGALKRLEEITPVSMQAVIHLSLTDEPPYAQALVIIEAV
jgi:holo-[acyl-carrier protein] synthase